MDFLQTQLVAMRCFVTMAKGASKYTVSERHGFLTYAIMHACQAAVMGNRDGQSTLYSLTTHDYKHLLIKAADKVMDGMSIDEALADVPEYKHVPAHILTPEELEAIFDAATRQQPAHGQPVDGEAGQ